MAVAHLADADDDLDPAASMRRLDQARLEVLGVELEQRRFASPARAGHHQRRLSQAVARVEARLAKTARRKRVAERLDRLGADRFGPAERDVPHAER